MTEQRGSRGPAKSGRPARSGPARSKAGSKPGQRQGPGARRSEGDGRSGPKRDRDGDARGRGPKRDGDARGRGPKRDGDDRRSGPKRDRDGDARGRGPKRDGDKRRGSDSRGRAGKTSRDGNWRDAPPAEAGPQHWGALARRGAAKLNEADAQPVELEDDRPAPNYDDDPVALAKYEARMAKRAAGDANRERLRDEAQAAIDRAGRPVPRKRTPRAASEPLERRQLIARKLPDPKRQLKDLLGESGGGRAWRDLNTAAEHVEAGRAGEAKPIMQRLYKRAPEVLEVAELYGLTLYGLGRWRDAIEILEDVREKSGLPDQNPVLADAHRAVGNFRDVEVLWAELREASPSSDLVAEGRIVAAGALADQGRIADAVRLLGKGFKRPKRPLEHHMRTAYALAELYERAGETPLAKDLFGWIAHHDAGFLDAAARR